MDVNLPSQDSATGRGMKTAVQAIIGFVVGLAIVVWRVDGVPQVIQNYIATHLLEVIMTIGLPVATSTGIVSFVWNLFRRDVPNY
jgi:small basic protein